MIPLEHYLWVSVALFCIGVAIVITKRNMIVILIGIELILNAANINFVAFSQYDETGLKGQVFALFVMIVAAAEAAVALAIIVQVYKYFKTSNLDEIARLKD